MGQLYFDNDIVHKLSRCNLFQESLQVLGCDIASVRVLDTLEHRFRLNKPQEKAIAKCGDQETVDRMRAAVKAAGTIPLPTDADLLDELMAIDRMDLGEARMIVSALETNGVILLTGDKKAIRALMASASFSERLRERFICLEQIMLWLIREFGFPLVHARVFPARECDNVLKTAFSSSSTEKTALEALHYYLDDLRKDTGDLLVSDSWCVVQ